MRDDFNLDAVRDAAGKRAAHAGRGFSGRYAEQAPAGRDRARISLDGI